MRARRSPKMQPYCEGPMTTAICRWGARAARGAFTRALVLLLATLGVLAMTATPIAAQSLTRGPVMIETHHTDLAGNIRLSTNEAGDVTQRLDYAPFGEVDGRSCTGDGDPTRSPQFQGKLRDPKTCLDDFGARDYYMVTGRFQSVDPVLPIETALRDPQQWNRYAYARNNPLIYTDPDGRHPALIALAAAVYGAFEYLSTAYDVYQAGRTLADPNATAGDKLLASGQVAAGVGLPGPGAFWGKAARKVDDVVDGARVVENGASASKGALPSVPAGPGTVPQSGRDPKRVFTPAEREAKRAEQMGQCANGCGTVIDNTNSRGHHIRRHADGGKTLPENHAEVCKDCHDEIHNGKRRK